MSVSCEAYIGYTVNLATDLTEKDFEFFDNAEDIELPDRVQIIVDGMCGHYARLIYVDKILDCWCDEIEYLPLKVPEEIPTHIFRELNKAYCALYKRLLNKNQIEYALSFHYY